MSDYQKDEDPALVAARQRSQEIARFIKENRAAPNKGVGGHVRDLGLTALSGAVSVPELAVGLADIPTGGRVGKFLENENGAFGFRPGEAKAAIAGAKTKRSQEQLQEFTDTEGLGGKVGYALKNPSLITNTVVESLPSMFAGGVIGRGLGAAAKGLSPVAAGALGEGAVGAGLAAEQIRQQTDDGLLTGKQAGLAAATGATTAGFGYAGGRLARKLGIGDIDTIVAGGGRTATPGSEIIGSNAVSKGIARRAAEGALTEGLLEELPQSVSETILQNEALGRPLNEGVTDAAALGLLSGAVMGAGAGMFARNRRPEDRITPTEDMGQEGADYGPTNPNNPLSGRGLPNPTPLLENQAAPQLGFQGRASNQFNAGPDGEVFTGDQYNEYLAGQQERARNARDAGQSQPRNFEDVTQSPQGYDQFGNDPRLPAPDGTDFTASQDGQVYGRDDINTRLSQERDAAAERRARIARGEILDRTPIPEAPKPSELMGLDPNKGSLSAAAALAVDSGASDVGNQLRDAAVQEPQMSVWQSGMMDRLSNADQNNSTYARLAQAMQNEPTSVAEKTRLMREASELPRAEVAAKQIKPNTRVLDEARAQTKAYTPEGKEVQAQWDVVDASELVTSNTDSFTINPNFPASRQPRDRTRASAQQQVNDIASKLQPNLLGESPDVSTGAPFVGANDNIVDSGNGRSMAIRRVYQEGGEKAGEYRQFVNEQAAKFGLDTDAVNMMQSPVLVRRNISDMNRDEFARAANKPTAARMSSTEQAASDAKNLPDASLLSFNGDGNMSLYQSQSYLKNFIAGLPSTEQSAMMDNKGALSREGKNRIEAAIVQDAYNNPKLVSAISEKLDNDTTNVLRAITDKAPQISQINADIKTGDVFDNTLARDIADATQAYMDIKNSEQDVDDYLSQDSLFDDGLTDGAKEILSVLSDNRRSAKAIGEYLQSRINQVTGRGNPKQVSMFDDEFETDAPNVLSNEPAPTNTQAATQLTDENPTVNIPAPTPEVSNEKSKTKYRLPTEEESYWRLSQPSTERESVLVDAVSQALDEGVIYNKDLNKRVAEILNIPQSVLDVNTRNTENGDFGYDVYSARKKVEANNRDNSNNEARERLKSRLSVGRNIGTIVIDNGKTLRRATIESMDDKSVKIAGTTGSKRLMYGVNYSTLEDAIKRAEDEGKREKFTPPKVAAAATESEATPESKLAEKYGFNDSNKLDHGELSIPNRTKNINNELDKYKADKAKIDARKLDEVKTKNAEKAEAEKERLLPIKEQAQADYKQYGTAMVNAYKDKLEAQGVNARDFFRDEAKYNPESFLKLSKKFQEEQQAEPKGSASVIESTNKPNPTGDWQTQMNGNEFRINEDGITVRKHDRVVHIRGANSITASKKAKELANQDIRELHYIAAKEDANDPFSEGSIWLDGNGDMVRKKGTKKPTGSLLPILKQAETKTAPKKADKPAPPIETVAEIEDFGEKITGARKDMDSFYQKEITDDDISSQPLSKTWPKKDIESIEDKQAAALATVLRGTIPSKPRQGYNLKGWVEKVKSARGIMQQIMNDGEMVERFIDSLTKVKSLQTTGYHAQLLTNIDREQWSRVTAVDHRPYYTVKNDDGSTSPDMSFDITIDKRRHVILTENKQISEVVDKVNEILSGEVKTPTLKFDLYSRGRGDAKSWFITQTSDKDKTPLITFNDRDTARAFLKENNNELSELWAQHKEKVNVKKTDTRSRQNRERIGPDHRGGLDVTTEQFMEAFGLRGGQFGNWVKQGANTKDRQGMLNETYDAFMDLAGVLNIPPEAIGLGGKLGMSFGARGKGAAMAHYEPSQVVINLTKTKGAGTLAHEWFHALDHHFTSFRDSSDRNKTREGTYITYKPEPSMMYTPQKGRGYLISKPALKKRQANSKDPMYAAENWAPDPAHPQGVRPKVEEAFADLVNALNDSPMKDRATTIDKGATDGYWSRIIERAARAFESYIIHKLDKQGARSDFLANVTPENAFPRNMDRYPYLLESEMAPVAEAFDNLFATLDSKASEDGNGKTLFSRAGQMKQTMDNVKAGAIGSTNTTRQQVITKLSNKFGKETISKLMADGKLDIKVLSDFVKNGRLTIPSDVDGLYLNGKATLIADNLSDEMIIPTFLHELGGHGGMQTLMDKKAYDALMKDFDALVKAGDPLAVHAKTIADKVARNKQEALDEYLPYLLTLASRQQVRQGKIAGMINRMVMAVRSFLRDMLGVSIKINSQDILSLAERMVNEVEKQNSAFDTMNAMPQFSDPKNPDIRFSRAAGMNDQFDPRNIAKETATRLYDWASSAPPGKLSWWHKTIGTMYNLAQRNPYFKPVFENTEKFINDVSFYAAKASELAPRLLPQLDSLRDITKSAIGAKDNEALSKPIFEGTLLWGRDLNGKAVLIEDWRKKVMAASKQDRLQMLKDANRITPAQLQQLSTLNNIQANRFINGIIDEEVSAGLVWTDSELRSKFDLSDEQIELYREFRSATDKSLDSLTRSDMLRRLGKDANDIETAVMEAGTLREAVFNIEQHINSLIQASPKKEKSLKNTLKDIKESQFRTNKLIDNGYAPLSRFGQYTVDVVDADGNREYFGMFESAYEARKMEAEMKALYDDPATHTVSRGTLSNEEFKLFAGVTPETAELFGEMLGLDATGDKAADEAFQEYLKRTKNNRSAMKRLMHRKGIKGYSEDVGRVLASFIYSNARHTSAALNMSNIDRAITDIPKGEGQLKDAAVKLAEYIKNPQEEAQLMRGWMFAQYLGGSIASAVVNITQPIAVSFPYLSQFGGAVKAASQLGRASSDWTKAFKDKDRSHFEPDLLEAIERAEADGTLSPQEVHNLLKQAAGKNPLSAGDGTKIGDARALAGNALSRVSLAWGSLFSGAEQINRRVTFVAAYRLAKEQGMDNPADFATKSIKETQFVYNKASRMNWGRGAVGGTLMTFKTYTVSYIELMHRLWNQGEKGSVERAQGRKATMIMLGVMFLLSGSGGLPFMEDAEDLIDGIGQIMGYNLSSKKARQDFLDAWFGEMLGDFLESGASTLPGSPTDVSGRLGLGNLIPGTGIFKERTNNTRDVLEIAGPAGDFAGRIATGTRDIAKGVANLDATSLKKGALEFSPTAVRNAVKGIDMGTSGIYKDTKGYKVTDVSPVDAAFKFAGFQPLKVSKIQEANYLGQTATSFYSLRASNIRALWAAGVVEGNSSKVADAKAAVKDWNTKNPDQKIVIRPTDIARRVREMRMDKSERVTKLAPKSMRAQMAQDFSQVRDGF